MKWGMIPMFGVVFGLLYGFGNPLWGCIFLGLIASGIYWVIMEARSLSLEG